MASSRTPLLADDRRHSNDSYEDDEERAILGGLFTTSPARPFATSFHPTLYTRGLALILSVPAFIIFIVLGPHFSPSIVFLSFMIARQAVVLGTYFGSQILVVHIEIVHPRWKSASAKAQEKWIKNTVAAVIDGGILLGLLVALSVVAHEINTSHKLPFRYVPSAKAAVILGFLSFGLLLLSVPDFGSPNLVNTAIIAERPIAGLLRLATSVEYGEPDEADENETHEQRRYGKSKPRVPAEDEV